MINITHSDYYPGGMSLPGRQYSSDKYSFGFNGKEKDSEVKGEGAQYDYGFRIYDPRIVRFLSVDPLKSKFPFYSPYHFAGNKPIVCLDIDGLEDVYYGNTFNGNEAMIKVFYETEVCVELEKEFKNTDPNLYGGSVNVGWDLLIIKGTRLDNGNYGYKTELTVEDIKRLLEDPTYQNYTSGSYYQLLKNMPIELLKKIVSTEGKKGIIIVTIIEDDVKKADEMASRGYWEKAGENAFALCHEERAHAINTSRGKDIDQSVEHDEYHRNDDGSTFGGGTMSPENSVIESRYSTSQAGKDLNAVKTTAKKFESAGKKNK